MRILITGANGLLGGSLLAVFAERGHQPEPLSRSLWAGIAPRRLAPLLAGAELVVHAAANTNVERCEVDVDGCYRDNYFWSEMLAQAAALAGVPMVYISSTGVYGAHQTNPYIETSLTVPTTHHHRAKLLAEGAVLRAAPANLVLRTGWLFGGQPANPKNFVARRLDEARSLLAAGKAMHANVEQRGIPTYAVDVTMRLLELVELGHSGVFNCVNQGSASRLEYVRSILQLSGQDMPVAPVAGSTFNRKAQVSNNEVATNWKMDLLGMAPMPGWQESLEIYLCNSGLLNFERMP